MNSGKEQRFRNELKYICSDAELEILRARVSSVMKLDPYARQGGYTIRSIYFDDLFDTCKHENEDGTSPREKWRIRSYNLNSDRIVLECKRKERGMINKVSTAISYDQFQSILARRLYMTADNPPVLNRFLKLQQTRLFRPKVIVEYERQPYIYKLGNVRVTFDRNIASSPDIRSFFSENMFKRPILPEKHQLLEIKYDAYIPDFIYQSIQMTNMQRVTFSKYYMCRKFSLGGLNEFS